MIAGVMIGSAWSRKIDADKLRQIFAWFLLGLAIFIVVYEGFFSGVE